MPSRKCIYCGLPHDARACPAGVASVSEFEIDDAETNALPRAGDVSHGGGDRASLSGVIVGNYQLRELIGEGGMSEVYDALHLELGKSVAIKVLHRERAGDRRAITRLAHEARVVASLKHPNICETYDLGRLTDGRPYIVMDRLHGETLGQRLEREAALDARELVPLTVQLLSALAAVHRIGVIHRDLKPDNIFLTPRPGATATVKLLDFGVARSVADQTPITRVGFVAGTPLYMAPEHIVGKRALDARVDVWGTGIIMYEALVGQPPFWAVKYPALMHQITTSPHRPLCDLDPTIPRDLAAIVDRALAKDREQRFQSAAEFRDALLALPWARELVAPRSVRPPPQSSRAPAPAPQPLASFPFDDVRPGRSGLPYLGEHDTTETNLGRLLQNAAVEQQAGVERDTSEFPLLKRSARRPRTKDGPPNLRNGPAGPKRR